VPMAVAVSPHPPSINSVAGSFDLVKSHQSSK
jgi:hypothetical protein